MLEGVDADRDEHFVPAGSGEVDNGAVAAVDAMMLVDAPLHDEMVTAHVLLPVCALALRLGDGHGGHDAPRL